VSPEDLKADGFLVKPSLPLGYLCHDAGGKPWLFIGSRKTSIGSCQHVFRRAVVGFYQAYEYSASRADTIMTKFPDLKFEGEEDECRDDPGRRPSATG
jgi:hypothetical protein